MTEAKVPDNKSDWKSIDIFLFSNGQQSSPPRKYHLETDQLDWWKATLSFLAKTQYGSMHSMVDLYTVDGKMIETPMQLSHNTAYVAVAPPDSFIEAGYEKYLVKATRSWEKGQGRRSSNTAVIIPDEHHTANNNSNSDTSTRPYESYNIKDIRDGSVTLKTIVASMVDHHASVIVKPEVTTDKKNNNTVDSNPVKPADKSNRPIQRPSIVKNNVQPSLPRSRKPSLKMKDSVKIITERKDRLPLSSGNNKTPVRIKPIQKRKDSLGETVLAKVEEIAQEVSSTSYRENNNMSVESKTTYAKNIAENMEVVSNLYKNEFTDKPSITVDTDLPSVCVNRQGGEHELFETTINSTQSNNRPNHPTIETNFEKIASQEYSESTIAYVSKNNTDNPLFHELGPPSPIVSNVIKHENDAVINKEGTFNLKLNIEIWSNEAKFIPNTEFKKDFQAIPTQNKESQVDIEAKSSGHDKPFHTVIREMNGNEENKVVFVKCSCLKQGCEETNNVFPLNSGNNNFLVFLQVLKLNEDCNLRCDCNKNKDDQSTKHPSVDYSVKKTTSCMSLYNERVDKINSHGEITSRNNSTEIKIDANSINSRNEMINVKRKSVAIKEDQGLITLMDKPKEPVETAEHPKAVGALGPDKSDLIIVRKESTGIKHKSINKFTQTKWCDVLLEVKLQSDGHYSFHMPTLEMLKNYKL